MNPELWGPKMWFYMHTVAINYPDTSSNEDTKHYRNFFENLKYTIPCGSCRVNYINHFNEIPIRLDSKMELFNWTVDIHNKVNGLLGKPILSYSEAIAIYTELYKDQYINNNNIEYFQNNTGLVKKKSVTAFIIVIVVLILIIVFLSVLLFKKRGKK